MRQNLTLWEKALSEVLNQAVKFDESDVFLAEIEQQLINFHYQDTVLIIFACAGQLENQQQATALLQANCFWQGTKGATFSTMDDGTIVLALQCRIQNKANLNQLLTDYLITLNYWSHRLLCDLSLPKENAPQKLQTTKAESKRWLSIDLI
ncbi:type III secretion system chaperone [Shewanella sp. 202IG2-18]|uniref:type III secretion system chaperone n=1 Tax=Parashewanella hymeniacidonis TaxID=2807618 RepID=UPI00196078E2|nr:type III secretion system chaperone [Parashewanella hymeniacidonis]MBM7071993.1 type III secretion system chaperone [Parashewanella hymeniacidonis]